MIEKGMKIDEIVCIDTGMEFPEMYEHIEKVKEYIKPYEITVLKSKYNFEYYLGKIVKQQGKNKEKVGYGWPDFRNRWCTYWLKYKPIFDYFKTIEGDVIEYHGIAIDEEERSNNNKDRNIKYPLINWNMTEKDCLQYCYDKGFDWGGLYEKMGRVSCYCCPLSTLKELKILYNNYSELWQNMKELDKKSFRKFRSDYSLEQLEDRFKYNSLWNCKDS